MTENGLLDDAVRFLEQGRFREAEEIYWRILQTDPNHAGALHLLGVVRHLQGDHEAAIKLIGRAIELNPVNAVYRNNYGLPLHSLDRFAEALDSFRRALEINPRYAQAMANLGMAQQSLGEHEAAMASFREALNLEPYHGDALIKLAKLLEKLGRHEEAIELYEDGIGHAPCLHFYVNLGALLIATDRAAAAIAPLQTAMTLAPGCVPAHVNLGMAYHALGNHETALESLRRALELQPRHLDALKRYTAVLKKVGRSGEAIAFYEKAAAGPANAETHVEFGNLLLSLGQSDRAIDQYRKAIELVAGRTPHAPREAEHHAECETEHHAERDEYKKALPAEGTYLAEAHFGLANSLKDQGKIEEAASHYRRAVELKPDSALMHSNLLLCEQYRESVSPAGLAAEHAEWDRRFAAKLKALTPCPSPEYGRGENEALTPTMGTWCPPCPKYGRGEEQRTLRLGFVSGNFREHPVGFFTVRAVEALRKDPSPPAPLPQAGEGRIASSPRLWVHGARTLPQAGEGRVLARDRAEGPGRVPDEFLEHLAERDEYAECEVYCYSDTSRKDDVTARFVAAADHWVDTEKLSDEELAERIRSDRIDVLFDMGGHLGGNRLLVFARKPVPIQVKWVGYAGSSGLTAMDYLLADPHQVEAGGEAHYPEKVLRLADDYVCFDPPAEAPEVGPLPALMQGHVTFGSFNNPAKINPGVVAAWAEILRRVPGARLVLTYPGFEQAGTRSYYETLFSAQGVGRERLELLGGSRRAGMLAEYNRVDIVLDPFPYSGGITTCEALWMGVPVITWPGKTFAGRHSLSHLSNVGLTETVARDRANYIALAVQLANDLPRLEKLRGELRGRVARSPLCDGPRFAANLMAALRSIWQEHVKHSW